MQEGYIFDITYEAYGRTINWQMELARIIPFSGIFLPLNIKKRGLWCIELNYMFATKPILQNIMNPI
jgi:hypothetical protein